MSSRKVADAMLARDFAALADGLAPDVVLHSPITARFRFEGRDEVLALMRIVRDTLDDLDYLHVSEGNGEGTLFFRATVGGQPLEGSDYLRFDERGRVTEFRVFIRPLPALAKLAAALAPPLARRHSRARALLLRALVAPLVLFNRLGDAIGARLVR